MRSFLFSIFLLASFDAFSQKVVIKGTAFDTTNGRNWVHVVVNDTLRRFRDSKTPNWDNYKKLVDDTGVHLFAKTDGRFQITASKTDSIFFQSFRHVQKVYSVSDLLKMKD